ncbi:MAG: ribose 5-phosphate isomerase B [Vicinamibacterales bacterium]
MKRFEIITEADARVLPEGSAVQLAKGGHVTPLALDTLRARRITVSRDDAAPADAAALVPVAEIKTVSIGSDHTGIALRKTLMTFLRGRGIAVNDVGTHSTESVDYPDIAEAVARPVARGEADAGIVVDGAGIGSAIAANKVHGIRAVMATTETVARYSREHNGANVLSLGASLLTADEATAIVAAWISTAMREPRYIRRLTKIDALERRG